MNENKQITKEELLNIQIIKTKITSLQKDVDIANMELKYAILQLYFKYGLPENASIDSDGKIIVSNEENLNT